MEKEKKNKGEYLKNKFNLKNLKSKKKVIYYIILTIFILIGFIVGCYTREEDGGYVIEYHKYGYNYVTNKYGKVWDYVTGDGFKKIKYFGWFSFTFKYETHYYTYLGDIVAELPKEQARALAYEKVPEDLKHDSEVIYSMNNDKDKFEKVYKTNIYIVIIIFILLIIAPFIVPLLFKIFKNLFNKHKENNKLSELKKLNELKENGLISNEEFETRKEKLLK